MMKAPFGDSHLSTPLKLLFQHGNHVLIPVHSEGTLLPLIPLMHYIVASAIMVQ